MKLLLIIIIVPILIYFVIYKTTNEKKENTVIKIDITHLTKTSEERAAIDCWANKSIDEIVEAEAKNNPVASYLLGDILLQGIEGSWPKDEETANVCFSKSASLGFAPALEQFFYVYRGWNPCLALVYYKLARQLGTQNFKAVMRKCVTIL